MKGQELLERTISLTADGHPAFTATNRSTAFGFNVLFNVPTKQKKIIKKHFTGTGVHVYSSRSNWLNRLVELELPGSAQKEGGTPWKILGPG